MVKYSKKFVAVIIAFVFLTIANFVLFHSLIINNKKVSLPYAFISSMELKPWAAIGGCGAGGSGGGSGDGIKWVGTGVSGGLVDVEIIKRTSIGQNFGTLSISPRLSTKKTPWNTSVGISLPVSLKLSEVQYQSNMAANNRTTGGMGDISLDFSKSFGLSGEYSFSIGLTFPTGQYDIKRGADKEARILPSSLQKGNGLYNASLGISKSIDVEDGIWLLDISYSNPFIARPISARNEFLDEYFSNYKGRNNNRRFYYRAKPYGENDLGAYTPPSLSGSVFYGYRGIKRFVHSWGLTFGAPLGVAWISSEIPGVYDPIPDPDHKAWSAAFIYGLEFSADKFPLFLSFSLPIHDRSNSGMNRYNSTPMKKWNLPDWKDFGQQWTFAIGIKATMF